MIAGSLPEARLETPCKSKVCTTRRMRSMAPSDPSIFLVLFYAGWEIVSRMVLETRMILCDSETFPNLADVEAEKSFPTNVPRRGKSEIGSLR